jgi:hypothetical protein
MGIGQVRQSVVPVIRVVTIMASTTSAVAIPRGGHLVWIVGSSREVRRPLLRYQTGRQRPTWALNAAVDDSTEPDGRLRLYSESGAAS